MEPQEGSPQDRAPLEEEGAGVGSEAAVSASEPEPAGPAEQGEAEGPALEQNPSANAGEDRVTPPAGSPTPDCSALEIPAEALAVPIPLSDTESDAPERGEGAPCAPQTAAPSELEAGGGESPQPPHPTEEGRPSSAPPPPDGTLEEAGPPTQGPDTVPPPEQPNRVRRSCPRHRSPLHPYAGPPPEGVPVWRWNFLSQLHTNSLKMEDLKFRINLQNDQKMQSSQICEICKKSTDRLEILKLYCEHSICMDCCDTQMQSRAEDIRKGNERGRKPHPALEQMIGRIIVCTICHSPSVIQKTRHDMCLGFRSAVHISFSVSAAATKDMIVVKERIWENQRKNFWGDYSASGLMKTDFRGPWSNEEGDPMLKESVGLPNQQWEWFGDWRASTLPVDFVAVAKAKEERRNSMRGRPAASGSSGNGAGLSAASGALHPDPDGWWYAFNWPGTGIMAGGSKWGNKPSATSCVRRRQWVRLRIRLTRADLVTLSRNLDDPSLAPKGTRKGPGGAGRDPSLSMAIPPTLTDSLANVRRGKSFYAMNPDRETSFGNGMVEGSFAISPASPQSPQSSSPSGSPFYR